MPLITFIIPVRHQDNAPDWPRLKANLAQTVASIAGQSHADWQGVVVCNEGADLPPLPANFAAVRVDFEPNRLHERGNATREEFLDAFRVDKGRRVLAGMLARRDSRYFMIVDDDDFVSSEITAHVARHPEQPGWKIDKGYVWSDGGKLLYILHDFNHICGTSLIIRSDLYQLPATAEEADMPWVMAMLGSHQAVDRILEEKGTPLKALPFPGAIYRVGHPGSHSQSNGILQRFIFKGRWYRNPLRLLRNVTRLRVLTDKARREFFGARA